MTVLLTAPQVALPLDLRVQAAFLGEYISFEPTCPPYKYQQSYLVEYKSEKSAILATDFVNGDTHFTPLHRNALLLPGLLPEVDLDVPEHEQDTVRRLQAATKLGSADFVQRLLSTFQDNTDDMLHKVHNWVTPYAQVGDLKHMDENETKLVMPRTGAADITGGGDYQQP